MKSDATSLTPRPGASTATATSRYMDIVCFFAQEPDEADDTAHQDTGDKLPGQLFSQAPPGARPHPVLSDSDCLTEGAGDVGGAVGRLRPL